MRVTWVAAVVVSAASLAGCVTAPKLNETNFAAGREAVIGSPAFFKISVTNCAAGVRGNPKALEMNMLLTGEGKERAPEVACERLTKAYQSGRMKYEHYAGIATGTYHPELVRIIQGR